MLRRNRRWVESGRWSASCKYVSIQPSVTGADSFRENLHVRDELIHFGDSLIQDAGRPRKVFEVVSDDLRSSSEPE